MKTPRDILLERHRDAEAKLDAIREKVVATEMPVAARHARPSFPIRAALALWRELFLPCGPIWAGVAAVWLVIVALHLSAGEKPGMAGRSSQPVDANALMALRERRQLMAQLLGPVSSSPADRPKSSGPRGDVRPTVQFA